MRIQNVCKECVVKQAMRMGDLLSLDKSGKEIVLSMANAHTANFDDALSPPENAYKFYEDAAKYLETNDIYKEFKKASSKKAEEFRAVCEQYIQDSEDKLLSATKIAVVGNVIDLASYMQYDLKEEVAKVLESRFFIDDFIFLKTALQNAREIVYISDNAGEEIFDKIYIKLIKELFCDVEVYYFTRGKPIINDITYQDALDSKMDEVAIVVDSGVPTPGFVPKLANEKALKLFKRADFIIAKGMGNYECLSERKESDIFYLFKVKCSVVGEDINAPLGALVCKKNLKVCSGKNC
ncbi:MAG: ARMT1-like domain-containing protein [Campylobacteraceae bacterium]|jgi:uncharacterized protein with ATP-grasp and redox domains|nr:ARMT1-like domain-containing protein [Campylobacteraceae bacterium]